MSGKSDPSPDDVRKFTAREALRRNRVLLHEIVDYRKGRKRVGEIVLRVRRLRREAHLITFADGEHLLIFVVNRAVLHWAAARDPVARLHRELCRWLTDAPWRE